MRIDRDDHGFDTIATLDIETTHYDPAEGEVVSIGVGLHSPGEPASEASYQLFHRDGRGEDLVIDDAMTWFHEQDPDGLVSYKGEGFDLDFLGKRLKHLGATDRTSLPRSIYRNHIDLYPDRKQRAEDLGEKWPSLEECLESYGYPVPETIWNGGVLTNTRFGEGLGPRYLDAIRAGDTLETLQEVIEHYLITDLEANFAVYYSDIGQPFEPRHLSNSREF